MRLAKGGPGHRSPVTREAKVIRVTADFTDVHGLVRRRTELEIGTLRVQRCGLA